MKCTFIMPCRWQLNNKQREDDFTFKEQDKNGCSWCATSFAYHSVICCTHCTSTCGTKTFTICSQILSKNCSSGAFFELFDIVLRHLWNKHLHTLPGNSLLRSFIWSSSFHRDNFIPKLKRISNLLGSLLLSALTRD